MEKKCCKCKKVLSVEEFYKNKSKKDGLTTECKVCNKVLKKARREANPEKVRKEGRKSYQNHKEKRIAKTKEWQENNSDLVKQYKQKNYNKNKEKYHSVANERYHTPEGKAKYQARVKKYSATEKGKLTNRTKRARRKALKQNLLSDYTPKQWEQCKKVFNGECAYCGKYNELTQDHFLPITKGGEYTINNILPVCRSCNSSKCNDDFSEWYIKQEFYSKEREIKILKYLNC